MSQLVSLTGSKMQTVALHWHVYLVAAAAPVVREYVQPGAPPPA